MTATVTLRVPADQATYQATLERLRGLAERVVDEQSQAQDVTEEYVDLDARLRNLRASEESLLQLLAKAQRVEDILSIQRELTNVRGQIEQIQGRKQALERRADMATITLTIREAGAFARPGWSPGGTFSEAYRALGAALRGLAVFAIWLAVFSPIWGGFLLLVWLFIWFIRRMVRRSRRAGPYRPRVDGPSRHAGRLTPARLLQGRISMSLSTGLRPHRAHDDELSLDRAPDPSWRAPQPIEARPRTAWPRPHRHD